MGLCPFHEDHDPSLAVYPETGSWHCFGCGKGGDVIGWVMEMEKVDFKEGVNRLAEKAGIGEEAYGSWLMDRKRQATSDKRQAETADGQEQGGKSQKEAEGARLKTERLEGIYRLAARAYAKDLEKHPDAVEYLVKERGLTEETIEKYGIGFCDGKGHLFEYLKKKGFSENELVESGLFNKNGEGIFRGRITLPNIVGGKVVYMAGRIFEGKRKK